jgi:23S rRNA (guanosine2251-2'-O)-methyltransferase
VNKRKRRGKESGMDVRPGAVSASREKPAATPPPQHDKAPAAALSGRDQATQGAPKANRAALAFRRPSAELAILYGFHCVTEALRNRSRRLLDLYATAPAAERLRQEIQSSGVALHLVQAEDLARRLGQDCVHQGLLLEARPLPNLQLDEITPRSGIILVLDQITDPHNVGAILRSAAAFSVDAVVTTQRHAPELSGVLAKAASGGLEHVAMIEVVNLARALEELGELGYLRIGLESAAPQALQSLAAGRPLALVLGAEGKGLRRLTRQNCDHLASLDLPGAIKSLNVSNACAIALSLVQTPQSATR